MIDFKKHNQPGLSLIEAVLALGILGIMMTSVVVMQQSSFGSLLVASQMLTRTFLNKEMLADASYFAAQHKEMPQKKNYEIPPPTVVYFTQKEPGQSSSLPKNGMLQRQEVIAEWDNEGKKRSTSLLRLMYKPKKKKQAS